ncbi:MAG: right-handed parallel beta-helix repeat-containing protein, partial [Solirubrobacteraceae bacterium]
AGDTDFGEGLQIFEGAGHTITHNQIVHNGTFAGIDSYSASNNTFADNEVVDNNILQEGSGHLAPKVQQDIGIWVLNLNSGDPSGATNNTVRANQVINNGLDGVQVARYANGNRVLDNEVFHNGFGQVKGIRDGDGVADFGNMNLVHGNTSVFNAANGVRVVFSKSSSTGLVVGGQDNTITGNRAFANGTGINSAGSAFDLTDTNVSPPCDANTWSANLFITINQPCVASH